MTILKKILNRLTPVSRAKYLKTLENIREVMEGYEQAEEQHSQMVISLIQDVNQLKQFFSGQPQPPAEEEKPVNGKSIDKSYA